MVTLRSAPARYHVTLLTNTQWAFPTRRYTSPTMSSDDMETSKMLCCPWRTQARSASLWRCAAAELAGTALLVLLSCLPAAAPATHRALAGGLVVTLLVQCFDHISGAQLNPTVTLAAALWRRVPAARALVFVCAQLAGASLGAAALRLFVPEHCTCVTLPAPDLSAVKAATLEAALGGCLVLANCAAWDSRTAGRASSWPLRLGLSVAALALVGGEYTGASMNPARSFGPALVSGIWTHHWVYWVGPLGGSVLCSVGYSRVWLPPPPPPPPPPAPSSPCCHKSLPLP